MPKAPKSPSASPAKASTAKPPRAPRSRASKPELKPLGEHLATLLNPALNEKPPGFAEAQQGFESFVSDGGESARPFSGMGGVEATMASLKDLLEHGDPNLRDKRPWTPHRPPRPEKSEGGITFKLVSDYEPRGDQPTAIEELVSGIRDGERDQVLLGVTGS